MTQEQTSLSQWESQHALSIYFKLVTKDLNINNKSSFCFFPYPGIQILYDGPVAMHKAPLTIFLFAQKE